MVTSVVVDKIDVDDIDAVKAKDDPPVRRNGHAPETSKIAGQRMEPQAGIVHIAWRPSDIEITQDTDDLAAVGSVQSGIVSALVEKL